MASAMSAEELLALPQEELVAEELLALPQEELVAEELVALPHEDLVAKDEPREVVDEEVNAAMLEAAIKRRREAAKRAPPKEVFLSCVPAFEAMDKAIGSVGNDSVRPCETPDSP